MGFECIYFGIGRDATRDYCLDGDSEGAVFVLAMLLRRGSSVYLIALCYTLGTVPWVQCAPGRLRMINSLSTYLRIEAMYPANYWEI